MGNWIEAAVLALHERATARETPAWVESRLDEARVALAMMVELQLAPMGWSAPLLDDDSRATVAAYVFTGAGLLAAACGGRPGGPLALALAESVLAEVMGAPGACDIAHLDAVMDRLRRGDRHAVDGVIAAEADRRQLVLRAQPEALQYRLLERMAPRGPAGNRRGIAMAFDPT